MRVMGTGLIIDRGSSKSNHEVNLFYICKCEGSYLGHKITLPPELTEVLFSHTREMPRYYLKSNHSQFLLHPRQFSSLIALAFYMHFEL
jgi:hypothetical protein